MKNPSHGGAGGFSLVEVLVAAMIMAITLIALIAVIRKGREIDSNDLHRRQARIIISAVFESQPYQFQNYTSLDTGTKTSTVTLDSLNRVNKLTGTLTIKTASTTIPITVNGNAVNIVAKKITASVSWSEPDFTDKISIDKLLTQAYSGI